MSNHETIFFSVITAGLFQAAVIVATISLLPNVDRRDRFVYIRIAIYHPVLHDVERGTAGDEVRDSTKESDVVASNANESNGVDLPPPYLERGGNTNVGCS